MKVVSSKICPFVQRVIGVLELKGIDYDVEYVSLRDKPDWFLKASPHAQVPIIIEDRGVLFESAAISDYLDEAYGGPKLYPDDPFNKAQHSAWAELAAKNYLVQCGVMRAATAETFEQKKAKFLSAFEKVESALEDGPYFAGDRLFMVDAVWYPLLHRAAVVEAHSGFDFLAAFPRVKNWQRSLLRVDALARSVAEDFEALFAGFYLSGETYLGRLAGRDVPLSHAG